MVRSAFPGLQEKGTDAVESLIDALNKGNQSIVTNAVELLGEIGDKRALEPIMSLSANDTELQGAIDDALKKLQREAD